MTREEQWSLFFAYGGDSEYLDLMNGLEGVRKEIKMARELLSTISQDENERARFRSRRMFQMDMEHDRAVTRDEARGETLENVAINALALGMTVDIITQLTGLSAKDIKKLKTKQ
jgi:predicted transposase/invertase (TIGR01784 family)